MYLLWYRTMQFLIIRRHRVVLIIRLLAVSMDPGGFRKLREARRIHLLNNTINYDNKHPIDSKKSLPRVLNHNSSPSRRRANGIGGNVSQASRSSPNPEGPWEITKQLMFYNPMCYSEK